MGRSSRLILLLFVYPRDVTTNDSDKMSTHSTPRPFTERSRLFGSHTVLPLRGGEDDVEWRVHTRASVRHNGETYHWSSESLGRTTSLSDT